MNNKVSFFLPVRKGSERVKDKNTRSFAGIKGGLIELKLRQLVLSQLIDEIIVSTNDMTCIEIAEEYTKIDKRLRIITRPEELCLSTTDLQDLICYVPTITDADHIVWGHVTTPFVGFDQYDEGIHLYLDKLSEGYDSLVGVVELKNFLLNTEGKLINNNKPILWPRTQDLEPLYEINHTMFIAKREVYVELKNRIGKTPLLHMMNKLYSFDIDWPDDFVIAEIMYKKFMINNPIY